MLNQAPSCMDASIHGSADGLSHIVYQVGHLGLVGKQVRIDRASGNLQQLCVRTLRNGETIPAQELKQCSRELRVQWKCQDAFLLDRHGVFGMSIRGLLESLVAVCL